MNASARLALRTTAIIGEGALLASTAAVAVTLVGQSNQILVWAVVGGVMSVEITRLPLVMRAGQLGGIARVGALALAAGLSVLTMETQLLGVEAVLTARDEQASIAATHLAEAETALGAAKTEAGRREAERVHLVEAVDAAQRHAADVSRESVSLQSNPAVGAYRTRKGGWVAPGAGAAGSIAAANAKAQADHAAREAQSEADLASARLTLAGLQPLDIKAAEQAVVDAQQNFTKEQANSPMRRTAAMVFGTPTASPAQYESLRRAIAISVAVLVSSATLGAGLISSAPDRGERKPSKLVQTFRSLMLERRRRHTVVVHHNVPGPVQVQFRDRLVHVPVDDQGRVLSDNRRAS